MTSWEYAAMIRRTVTLGFAAATAAEAAKYGRLHAYLTFRWRALNRRNGRPV